MELQILSKAQLDQIHEATLEILAKTGVAFTHAVALDLLQEHGAEVNGNRLLLPPDLVEKCLSQCPSEVCLSGRDPQKQIKLGCGDWFAHNVGGVPNVLEGKDRRPATRGDVVRATRLLDALPNVASITPHFTPQDVPPERMELMMFYETITNTTKPVRAPGTHAANDVIAMAEMADIAFPNKGRQGLTVGISPISPLTFPDNIVEAMMETARQKMVLGPLPCPIMGATAPMSIVGAVASQNAEVLTSIVLAQLITPGLPIIYKGRLSLIDPHTALSVWGNPELGLISALTAQVGHYYHLPVDVYGLSTNSHTHDIQNGYERFSSALLPVLAGSDEISGVGEMDSGVNSSLIQMVIDDEILASIARLKKGVHCDENALAVGLVDSVMKGSGNFLGEVHTVKCLRGGEIVFTELAERGSWSEWEKAGRPSLVERAESKKVDLLLEAEKNHVPLSDQQLTELGKVIS